MFAILNAVMKMTGVFEDHSDKTVNKHHIL